VKKALELAAFPYTSILRDGWGKTGREEKGEEGANSSVDRYVG